MPIAKVASSFDTLARPYRAYANARSAFKAFLTVLGLDKRETILLPAYVGWSSREGSGVFDPVQELGLNYAFYQLDARLHIDLDHLERRLQAGGVKVLVLIHYFGHVDPGYAAAVALARSHGAWVLEDEAHAMYTDLIGGLSGRLGDACLFSLHKMLPVPNGGLLVIANRHRALLERAACESVQTPLPWSYDLFAIAQRRRKNAEQLAGLLPRLAEHIEPLWGQLGPGEIPQTFPVLVRGVSRDYLYRRLNAVGFGAVSLYHTLISQLSCDEFPISYRLSRSILNLPIHQDATSDDLVAMVDQLGSAVQALSGAAHGGNGHAES